LYIKATPRISGCYRRV